MGGRGFGRRLVAELEPLLRHGAAALKVVVMLLLLGGGVKLLDLLFPDKDGYVAVIETIDIWLAIAVLSIFGTFTILEVLLRSIAALRREFKRNFRGDGDEDDENDDTLD